MNLYLDASALAKRYLREDGSETVRQALAAAERPLVCRVAFVEVSRAIALADGPDSPALGDFRSDWPAFEVVEVDQQLVHDAADLAVGHGLRSLDALHLAASLSLPPEDVTLATWDARLWRAGRAAGLRVVPDRL